MNGFKYDISMDALTTNSDLSDYSHESYIKSDQLKEDFLKYLGLAAKINLEPDLIILPESIISIANYHFTSENCQLYYLNATNGFKKTLQNFSVKSVKGKRRKRNFFDVPIQTKRRLCHPWEIDRKLSPHCIDLSSVLGQRLKEQMLRLHENIKMPDIVIHSLHAVGHCLDYESFCHFHNKSTRLSESYRSPFKFRARSKMFNQNTYAHEYKFSVRERRQFLPKLRSGLNARSRQLMRRFNGSTVHILRLTDQEIDGLWMTSKSIELDRKRCQENILTRLSKKKIEIPSTNTNGSKVEVIIDISSDSESDADSSKCSSNLNGWQKELCTAEFLHFKCNVCHSEIKYQRHEESVVSDHYRTQHNIHGIRVVQKHANNGQVVLMIVSSNSKITNQSFAPIVNNVPEVICID